MVLQASKTPAADAAQARRHALESVIEGHPLPLLLWYQDHSWAGICVAVAATEKEARAYMSDMENYLAGKPIHNKPIVAGTTLLSMGDM